MSSAAPSSYLLFPVMAANSGAVWQVTVSSGVFIGTAVKVSVLVNVLHYDPSPGLPQKVIFLDHVPQGRS